MRTPVYLLSIFCITATACTEMHQSDVWDTYDVRHPVPADSRVPDGYARQYDRYIDNDAYYSNPCMGGGQGPACVGPE